jgi:hypothetical protein
VTTATVARTGLSIALNFGSENLLKWLVETCERPCGRAADERDEHAPGRVEDRRGGLAIWQHSVSCPRSSNRTCRFPASGFPTSFIVRHTEKSSGRKRPLRGGCPPSPYDTAFSEGSGLSGVVRLIANHLPLNTGSAMHTPRSAAKAAGVSKSAIYGAIKTRRLSACKLERGQLRNLSC